MSEKEAWLWLAALIEEAPDYMRSLYMGGLCAVLLAMITDGAITERTFVEMKRRIDRELGRRIYLAHRGSWGAKRRDYCLKFAEEA